MSETVDLQALSDLATPWFLRVAVTLRLPELINDGIDEFRMMAEAVGVDVASTHVGTVECIVRGTTLARVSLSN